MVEDVVGPEADVPEGIEHPGVAWTDKGLCRSLLFDERGNVVPDAITRFFVEAGHVISDADREMCRRCPVRRECLTHSFLGAEGKMIPAGYFAGFSFGQRRSTPFIELLEIVESESAEFRQDVPAAR